MASVSQRKAGRNSLVALVGPNASGKSALGVKLAKALGGEVVSADSRQLYKGLDIGSGKITREEMKGVPHHLLDIASPKRRFTVAQYQKQARKAIGAIQKQGAIPFLVGGSPLYLYAVTDGTLFPEVKPDQILRNKLEGRSVEDLYNELEKIDPRRAKTIEPKNKRRLVRALEIVLQTGKPVPALRQNPLPFPILFLGVKRSGEELRKRIHARLKKRLKQGMIEEVRNLHDQDISWRRSEEFGLEYRWIALFLQKKISRVDMESGIEKDSSALAKHQMRWFKKDRRIHWISSSRQALALTKTFLR